MKCIICGGHTKEVKQNRPSKYGTEVMDVERNFSQCADCGEEFVSPAQIRENSRTVKNEFRKKYALLAPERIVEIRKKLGLSQADLERALGAGEKVVVRWESGKVIQSGGMDIMLRVLDRDPSVLKWLQQIQEMRAAEKEDYKHKHDSGRQVTCAV